MEFKGNYKVPIEGQYLTVYAAFKPNDQVLPYTPSGQSSPLNAEGPNEKGDYYFYANVPAGLTGWFVALGGPAGDQFIEGVAVSA